MFCSGSNWNGCRHDLWHDFVGWEGRMNWTEPVQLNDVTTQTALRRTQKWRPMSGNIFLDFIQTETYWVIFILSLYSWYQCWPYKALKSTKLLVILEVDRRLNVFKNTKRPSCLQLKQSRPSNAGLEEIRQKEVDLITNIEILLACSLVHAYYVAPLLHVISPWLITERNSMIHYLQSANLL